MTTAPTGQAVFDPFAPPASTSPQPAISNSVASSSVSTIQADNLPDNMDNNGSSTQVIVTPPVQVDSSTIATTSPGQNAISQANTSSQDIHDTDQIDQKIMEDSQRQAVVQHDQSDVAQVPDIDQEQDFDLTEDERLALFDQVLTETEQASSVFDQVMPAAIIASDPLNPQGAVSSSARKPETVASNSSPQEAGLIGQVEYEPSSELPVEVEGFLERVEDHADKLPQEIVIADEHAQVLPQSHPTQTVIMLPITAEDEEHPVKDVKLSLTWLLEWSHKIIKKFVGKVVYRHESNA